MELYIYDKIIEDECVQSILEKNQTVTMRKIIAFAEMYGLTKNSIREYVVTLLANDENILSHVAKRGGEVGSDLYKIALFDISQIYDKLFSATIKYTPTRAHKGFSEAYSDSVIKMTGAGSAKELLNALIMHYRTLGNGVLSRYTAFKYDGELKGIADVERVDFSSLVGLDYQKRILEDNTVSFLNGDTANNVLLFGDRGTGKSTSVKALLNMYADAGLRLVEVPKSKISRLTELTRILSESPNKYIVFLDDLSFESNDENAKALKVAMEGQLESHPSNVLVYATSNRRHLIKETVADREEMHRNDQMQETLSLAERFGISLVFSSPNQKEYLKIVRELLKRRGVEPTEEAEKAAIVWQMNYGGSRSGRCATQFVNNYVSKLSRERNDSL